MPHIVKSFDQDLDEIKNVINEMAGNVETQLIYALQSIDERDSDLARRIVDRDVKIDSLYERILDLSIRLFALRQPMANDLRFVISTNKIAADIERIGDQTKNIAKASRWLAEIPTSKNVLSISNLAKLVQDSFRKVMNAYNENDSSKAKKIWLEDVEINKGYDILFRETLTYMLEDPKNIASCSQIIAIAKNLERIGDLIQNIAEMIFFIKNGRTIPKTLSNSEFNKYRSEKKYTTSISKIYSKSKKIVKKK